MPSNSLNRQSPQSFSQWLPNELQDEASLVPHETDIPNQLQGVKGIYFWYMQVTGYEALSKFIRVSQIESVQLRKIDSENYHLVYIGTAGMGKNGGSDLFERLKWHIQDKHSNSAICSGALSTLRQGLGALLADDLITPSTEDAVNQFMKSFMRVFWVSYKEEENSINEDEFTLIQTLRPLLNIRNNPNALANASDNPTKNYKQRRLRIIGSSRKRLNCGNEQESKMSRGMPSSEINFRYKEQIGSSKGKCIEFSVYRNQSIAEVVRGIPGLPTGKVNISMFDAANNQRQVFPTWKKTGTGKQNIYTYFSNTGGGDKRYKLIKRYMELNNIDEIIVKVCDANETVSENLEPSLDEAIKEFDVLMSQALDDSKNTSQVVSDFDDQAQNTKEIIKKITTRFINLKSQIYLIPCCAAKEPDGNTVSALQNLSFNELLYSCRKKILTMYNNAGNPPLNWKKCLPAVNRYNGIVYRPDVQALITANPDKFLIVSALFGIIKPTDLIPDYNLTMTTIFNGNTVADYWRDNYSDCIACILNKVLSTIKRDNPEISFVHLLSNEYQKAFCGFTNNQRPPALNYIPQLVLPPNPVSIDFDNWGHWKPNYLITHF